MQLIRSHVNTKKNFFFFAVQFKLVFDYLFFWMNNFEQKKFVLGGLLNLHCDVMKFMQNGPEKCAVWVVKNHLHIFLPHFQPF